jgi:hypothetical protein
MPLQIRRGTTAQRLAITPLTGELIHDTTTGQLFVGNGTTVGGVTTTGISSEDAADAAASLFSTGSHSGITFAYNDAAGRIDATVTVAATGPFDGDLIGSVFADNSTLLVDGTNGALVGPIATSGNSNFGNNTVDGNIYIVRNTALTGRFQGMTFAQHHETPDATNLTFYRTRGTSSTPTPVVDGDRLGDIVFLGGGSGVGAVIEARYADGNPNVRLAGNGNSWINRSYGSVGIGTCTPNYMLDVNGAINTTAGTLYSNSVVTYAIGGTMLGTTAAYYDFPAWNDGGQGQMFEIKAFFDHFYNWGYGAHYYVYLTSRETNTQALTMFSCPTGNGGSWMAYKPNTTTLRVCKIAGTYGGGGAYWIQVTAKQP